MNELSLRKFEGKQDATHNYVRDFDSLISLLRNHKSLPSVPSTLFFENCTTYNA